MAVWFRFWCLTRPCQKQALINTKKNKQIALLDTPLIDNQQIDVIPDPIYDYQLPA